VYALEKEADLDPSYDATAMRMGFLQASSTAPKWCLQSSMGCVVTFHLPIIFVLLVVLLAAVVRVGLAHCFSSNRGVGVQ
jgi:hypothetical protein